MDKSYMFIIRLCVCWTRCGGGGGGGGGVCVCVCVFTRFNAV